MPYKQWSDLDAGAISFGQGISVSALQLITATSSIANGGIIMKPYIVQAVTDHNGRLIESFGPEKIRRVISARTADTLVMMMRSVVQEGGTGTQAALEGYSVCGKTGTAQKINENGQYTKGKYTASFVGFVPAENPEISIVVIIDEPQKAHFGGTVAAPVFRKIALETLDYMNITPQQGIEKFIVSIGNKAKG
jgi:cell division protein FtsI (penicillin-binding protein 3)